jgi:hypothetical protein
VKHLLVAFAVAAGAAAPALADDVYKWTDESGRVHFSNRPQNDAGDHDEAPAADGEGWESVLERQQGSEEIAAQAESAINTLQMQKIRRSRDRDRQAADLEALRVDIGRAQNTSPNSVPDLRAREATQVAELNRIENDLRDIDMKIARYRALKQAGKDQAGRSLIEQ